MDARTPPGARHSSDTPLQLLAHMLRMLTYTDFMTLARDLHSDSQSLGKTSEEVADTLARWAAHQLGETSP